MGQAMRYGYIVIAVDWRKDGQKQYEYSAREHAAVLSSLRDACRRFSVDTDPRLSLRALDRRRRRLGPGPVAPRPVGGRDSDRRHGW